jgi:hypothetical protein
MLRQYAEHIVGLPDAQADEADAARRCPVERIGKVTADALQARAE